MLTTEDQILKQLDKANSILIVFSMNWDEDAVAASLALFLYLKKLNKNVELSASNTFQKNLIFLPGFEEIKNNLEHLRRFIVSLDISNTKISQIKYIVENNQLNFIISPEDGWFETKDVSSRADKFRFDLVVCLGANDLESLGEIYDKNIEFFYKTPIINLSCHPASEEFGQINFIDLSVITLSEIIFKILKIKDPLLINENIATNLLAGILIKTKNFKTDNLTPEVLMTASELISLGARREEIINQVHKLKSVPDLKLWGKILNNLSLEKNNQIAWSYLKKGDYSEQSLTQNSIQALIEELITNLSETKIFVLFEEKSDDSTDVYLFILKRINIVNLLNTYKLDNNKLNYTFNLPNKLESVKDIIIKELQESLDKLNV